MIFLTFWGTQGMAKIGKRGCFKKQTPEIISELIILFRNAYGEDCGFFFFFLTWNALSCIGLFHFSIILDLHIPCSKDFHFQHFRSISWLWKKSAGTIYGNTEGQQQIWWQNSPSSSSPMLQLLPKLHCQNKLTQSLLNEDIKY